MALVIPSVVSARCKSSAERTMHRRCMSELGPEYVVFHSMGVAKHPVKTYAEIDFLIVGRNAVVALEVKGGRVACEGGIWEFTDRYGRIARKMESPMRQAATAAAALGQAVRAHFGKGSPVSSLVFGHASYFPDCEFAVRSGEWDPRRVFDLTAAGRPLGELVDEMFRYSQEDAKQRGQPPSGPLVDANYEELLDFLRPDFEAAALVGAQLRDLQEQLVHLSSRQLNVLTSLRHSPQLLVTGYAGTGKTLLAEEAARRSGAAGKKTLFLCHSQLLADLVAADLAGIPNVTVSSLLEYCRGIFRRAGMESTVSGRSADELFRSVFPALFADAFRKADPGGAFQYLVVDEGQDFGNHSGQMALIDGLVEGGLRNGSWIWFEDPQQAIINRVEGTAPFDFSEIDPHRFELVDNWRNTPEVADFTRLASGMSIPGSVRDRGLDVETVVCGGLPHQRGELERTVKRMLQERVRPEDIVILTVRSGPDWTGASLPRIGGVPLTGYVPAAPDGAIRYANVFSFKGLEAKLVILCDLEELDTELGRMAAYVAMSRSTGHLIVLLSAAAAETVSKARIKQSIAAIAGDLNG